MKEVGAWFLFLPPYSPDLNPIEMAIAQLKALIRRAAARTYDELWQAVGHVCDLSPTKNATTSSSPQDMEPFERNTLFPVFGDRLPVSSRMSRTVSFG